VLTDCRSKQDRAATRKIQTSKATMTEYEHQFKKKEIIKKIENPRTAYKPKEKWQ